MKYLLGVLLFVLSVSPVMANTAFWEDPETRIRLSYPFEWWQQTNVPADQLLHIRAPHNQDSAQCKVQAIKDERFVIFPRDIMSETVNRELSYDYWETFVARFKNPNILNIGFNGGLGQGDATYAEIDFTNDDAAPGKRMRGMYFASLYHDLNVNIGCFSEAEDFQKWKASFLSIIDTVKFPKEYNVVRNGYYRNFFADGVIYFKTGHTKGSISGY